MVSQICKNRLLKELRKMQTAPPENICAAPLESNILEWHYVIRGVTGPYNGGFYWGKLRFPPEYPMKPPSIYMITPNGRFQTDTRLCLSMSDFHPETWNPLWSVSTILMGLYAFMLETSPTAGSIETSDAFKRRCARESWEFNTKHKLFRELFPELTEEMEELIRTQPPLEPAPHSSQGRKTSSEAASCTQLLLSFAVVAGLLAICLHLS